MRAASIAAFHGLAALVLMLAEAEATQCVNPGGTGGCHASIQAAVNAALDGETVHVHAGSYTEFTTIPESGDGPGRSLEIEGEGTGVTVIDGGFDISRQWAVRVRDLTIMTDLVRVHLGAAVEVRDCELIGGSAIEALGAFVGVVDSVVSGSAVGVRVGFGGHAVVQGSTLSDNSQSGLQVEYAPGRRSVVEMATTLVENNAEGIRLSTARATVLDSTIRGNTFRGMSLDFATRLTMERSTVSGNATGSPAFGGIAIDSGVVRLVNSTVSGNGGHGIRVGDHGRLRVASSTVAANTADADGGGILVQTGGSVSVVNSILADNTAPAGSQCAGRLRSLGFNLVETDEPATCEITGGGGSDTTGVDPMLGALAANGGPTETHALLAGSPAIDAGNPAAPLGRGRACPRTDQRGASRVASIPCDIGAYETP